MNTSNSHSRNNQDNTDSIVNGFTEDAKNKASILLELYLEFFAVFIPGFLLATGIAVLLFFVPPFRNIPSKLLTLEMMHHGYNFFIFIILSYALGSILHRQSPDYINSRESLFSQFCQTPSIFSVNSVEGCKKNCTPKIKTLFLIRILTKEVYN